MKVSSAPFLILLAMMTIVASPVLGATATPTANPSVDRYEPPEGSLDPMKEVDEWLVSQDLNWYGDVMDTMYPGGSPLFNEETGERMDRYQYLLDKFHHFSTY